ncbi:uncharacterized protein DNG_02331 [Cephalotrichum gorgonifer]|uniref:Enoyl reductase (ER) domain-containing protein n=1 Tax=Cephalotrichum gorgonifer TaxID=2041049 RepID=A0AAE8MUM1_9PEZI|nr:uncharacterized protein DNG_02331 [Cephalotrichum gorgonifer]
MAPVVQRQLPSVQTQLLLHQPRSPYQTFHEGGMPELRPGELLVQVEAIGLNPIDWKSADFGFALPELPCLNGREFVGTIVDVNVPTGSRLVVGDQVLAVATDYRDFRKSAFQEYAVVCCFNAIKIPQGIDPHKAASLGVAFVTAALSLGVCLGIALPKQGKLPDLDLLSILQKQEEKDVPSDCYDAVFNPISPESRPHKGEWILIYGASSVTAQLCIQLAKTAGMRIIGVADVKKHSKRLTALGVDILVDRSDLDLAARQVREHTQGSLRFAMDMIGKETSTCLLYWCAQGPRA